MSHKEIAEKLDMSEDAVNKQIKRALRTLRVRLGLLTYVPFCFKYKVAHLKKNTPQNNSISVTQNVPLRKT